jgi:predicted RNA-binding protein with EMAP domain
MPDGFKGYIKIRPIQVMKLRLLDVQDLRYRCLFEPRKLFRIPKLLDLDRVSHIEIPCRCACHHQKEADRICA